MKDLIQEMLLSWGVAEATANLLAVISLLVLILLAAYTIYWLIRTQLLRLATTLTQRTSATWDNALMEAGVFHRALQLLPLTLMLVLVDRALPGEFDLLQRILLSLIILTGTRALEAFLNAAADIYHTGGGARRRPIRPVFQTLIIVLYLFAGIFIVSVLVNREPWHLLGLLGGMTAVTMLIFKDTILGFVASLQLSAYDMVREGDWIEMPKYGADGDVIAVTVNTVKVRNWDRTISTIPTYALVSDSIKNWRGMSESGGRRIKRSVSIDMNTVRFVDDAMLERFRKMDLLEDYVCRRQEEIDAENASRGIDLSDTAVNGRRQTNLGIFRAYLLEYLRNHPKIHTGMTLLVRHLQPTAQGLPIEIYVFSSDKVWANYESIQADIFDHVLAAVPEFDLRVYQQPSGADLAALGSRSETT